MTPDLLSHDQLVVFWIQLVVLLATARALGLLARRIGQPPVLGELTAGLLLGPSVLGEILPGVAGDLFPPGAVHDGLLLAVAWLGVVFLLVTTGFETDLRLVRTRLRASALVPVGSLVLPLAAGLAIGLAAPAAFRGPSADGPTLALFLAVALAISALPVVARILLDMGVMRRTFAQITIVAAMADDIVGWLLLGLFTGAVTGGGLALDDLARTIVAVLLFVVGIFTVGQRIVDRALRASYEVTEGFGGAFTVSLVVVFAAAALTQWIGVEAVVGAFFAGLVLGRSRYRSLRVKEAFELLTTSLFAPIFFASAGLSVDLGVLAEPTTAVWTAILLVVAVVSKVAGSYVGGRLTGMGHVPSLILGIGLNARGALGIVAATVALNVGVFNTRSYTAVVLMAVVTSMLVPPLLRPLLRRHEAEGDEEERLERERLLRGSMIPDVDHVLLPTRGGENSAAAARFVDLIAKSDATVTVLHVREPGSPESPHIDRVSHLLAGRSVTPQRVQGDPAEAVLAELRYGYGLLALGVSEEPGRPRQLSARLHEMIGRSRVPVLLVRTRRDPSFAQVDRIVVPATGTSIGRAAEEVAFTIAANAGAEVDVVHVIQRSDQLVLSAWQGAPQTHAGAEAVLATSVQLATRFGRNATATLVPHTTPHEGILEVARDRGADTVVASGRIRGEGFLGHGIEYLLEHADQDLVLLLFPDQRP